MDRISESKLMHNFVEVSYSIHFHNTGFNISSELNNHKLSKVKLTILRSKVNDA